MPSVSSIAAAAAAAGGAAGAFLGIFHCAKYILRLGNDRTNVQRRITVGRGLLDSFSFGIGIGTAYAAANVAGIVVTGSFHRISSLSLLLPAMRITHAAQFLVDVIQKGQVSESNIIQLASGIAAAAVHRHFFTADSIRPLSDTIITSLSFIAFSHQCHQITKLIFTTKLAHPVSGVVGAVGFAGGLAASLASINAYYAYIFARGSVAALEGRYIGDMMQNASRLGIAFTIIAGISWASINAIIAYRYLQMDMEWKNRHSYAAVAQNASELQMVTAVITGGPLRNFLFYTFGFVMQKIGVNGGSDMQRLCSLFVAIMSAAASTPLFVIAFNDMMDSIDYESDYNSKSSRPTYHITFLGACGSIFGAAAAAHMCGANAPVVAAAAAGAATAVSVSFFLS
jgi:hypothetical protein